MNRLIFSLLLLLGVTACCPTPTELLLQQAEEQMSVAPDSAMQLLQQANPIALQKQRLAAHHALLQAQRLIESENPIYCDSLLDVAVRYYTDHDRDPHLRARAFFYAGHARRAVGQMAEAMALYVEAEQSVRESDDELLRGRIMAAMGGLYRKQYHFRSGIECFEEAIRCFEKVGHQPFMLRGVMGLAVDYQQMGDRDQSNHYWMRAKELADRLQDSVAQLYIVRAAATELIEQRAYAEAIRQFREAADRWNKGVIPSDFYYGMAISYLRMQQYDSAALYLQSRIEDMEEQRRREEMYDQTFCHWNIHNEWLSGEYNATVGNYQQAYRHKSRALRAVDSLYRAEKRSPVPSIRGRALRLDLQERNHDLRTVVVLQWLLVCLFLVAALFLTMWLILRRRHILLRHKQTIARYQATIEALQENYQQEQLQPRDVVDSGVIDCRIDFLRSFLDIMSLYGHKEGTLIQKLNALISSESEQGLCWMIEDILNMRVPGIVEYLKQCHPSLTDREVCLYGMICLDMEKSAICVVLRITVKTYYNARNILRGKLQLTNNTMSFIDHFSALCEDFRRR